MNIFLIGMPEIHSLPLIKTIPDIVIEKNFQQVLGITKSHELEKLCIYMDAWNCDSHFNGERGQTVAEKIHDISPDIPILIWDGREYVSDEDIPPVFRVKGVLKPLRYDNEPYLSFDHYNKIFEITKKFFEGKLTVDDVPHRECLDINQKCF